MYFEREISTCLAFFSDLLITLSKKSQCYMKQLPKKLLHACISQLLYWTMFLKRIRNAWNISLALKGIFVQLLFTCLYIIKVINQCVKHISVKLPAMLTNNVYFCHRTCWYRFIMRLSVGFEIFKLELFKNTLIIILRNKWTFCRVKCMSGGKKHLETIKHKSVKTNTS